MAPAPSSGAEEPARAALSPVVDESSVRPGINAPYFQPNALDRYTGVLEGERREVVQHRDEIIRAMGLQEGMVVADIGAGTGLFTAEIAKRVGDKGAVFSVDIVPAFLDRIRERVEAEQLTNVTVVQGAERATALDPASVDLAFMCDTYHHIEYPQTYMNSLFRTLRPGATLVLIDFERIEGESLPAILKHVRADKQTVIDEVSQAGFVLESETELLKQNYYLHFRRP
jgi:ubiquinone/menaquinone biosynthesis C-methylase UbiE